MAFTLTHGAATKVVESEIQKDELVRKGWVLADGGTEGATTYDIHDYTNPTPHDFKGVGFCGEEPTSIAYKAKEAMVGVEDSEDYAALDDVAKRFSNHTPNATTYSSGIVTVDTLPASNQSATTVYLLKTKDATAGKKAGLYTWDATNTAWVEYTV